MNSIDIRSALAHEALKIVPPLIRDTLLEEPDFREEYGFTMDGVISFGDVSVQCSNFFPAVRKILSGASEENVTDTKNQKWKLKNINDERDTPCLLLFHGERSLSLPDDLVALSPDKDTRLHFLDKVSSDVNMPNSESDSWRNILSERVLEDDEFEVFYDEFRDTPVAKMRIILRDIKSGQGSTSSLVPLSRRYFERLVGVYDESNSITDYASGGGKKFFNQLSEWRPYDGFLFSLLLSSHSSMTAEINVDQLNDGDLVQAFEFLDRHGDRISQLGAIEVGLRILPLRPEIEQPLIRLIEQIRDDDVDGQASGFRILSALFYLIDGELSRTLLLSAEPPFYRKLAVLSQAGLIHRQLINSTVDIDQFSEWAFNNRGGYYIQSLADMRSEPRWDPNFATASQMKADFFGRILIAADKHEQNITGSQIYDLVFGNEVRSLQSLSYSLDPWLPGPLEGTEDMQNILPPQFAEAIETQLGAEEVGPSSFPALLNFALIFRIGADQAELAARALKFANHRIPKIENRQQLIAILDGLARVAAVSRSSTLADELQILVRRYRRDAKYGLSIQEVIRICLVAAASRSDLREWTEFVGKCLTEFAFVDLKDDEAQEFYSCLNWLCHIVPELWVSCGRADAALIAFNSR